MAVQPVPNMTPVPAFPALSERAAGTYNSSALAFGTHMHAVFNAELLAVANNVKYNADDSKASADTAALSVLAAAAKETAAAASAAAAASSANTAAASAGGQLWVSGTTYAVGALVFSAVTGRNYRRIVAGAGTTDPSADSTNWRAVLLDAATGLPTIRPTLLLDFVNSRSVDPRITFTRASAATRTNDRGLIETVAANVPRIDFDPVTLACRGLLVEETRTNYITNNTMQGAVVGSPGTTPTGWSAPSTGSGLTRTVVATGEEDGISYVDIRFEGTPTITVMSFIPAGINATAAASGQTWALSIYLRLVGGSFANTALGLQIVETDGTTTTASSVGPCVATGAPLVTQRFVYAATLSNAGTTHVQPRIRIGLTIGQPTDFTLRIGLPQLEAGGFATSVIPTAGAAATRAADVAVMTDSNFSSGYRQGEWTLYAESSSFMPSANYSVVALLNGTGAPYLGRHLTNSRGFGPAASIDAGNGTYQADVVVKQAMAARVNDYALATNGGTIFADTTTDNLPTDVSSLWIGNRSSLNSPLNGHIRRIAYYNKRLSNAELQALTTP